MPRNAPQMAGMALLPRCQSSHAGQGWLPAVGIQLVPLSQADSLISGRQNGSVLFGERLCQCNAEAPANLHQGWDIGLVEHAMAALTAAPDRLACFPKFFLFFKFYD